MRNLCDLYYDKYDRRTEAIQRGFERLLSQQPAADKHVKIAREGVTSLLACLAVGCGADPGLLAHLALRSAPVDDVNDDVDHHLRDDEARARHRPA